MSVERTRWSEHKPEARCDDGCGLLGEDKRAAVDHAEETGHVTFYRYVFEQVFQRREQGSHDAG